MKDVYCRGLASVLRQKNGRYCQHTHISQFHSRDWLNLSWWKLTWRRVITVSFIRPIWTVRKPVTFLWGLDTQSVVSASYHCGTGTSYKYFCMKYCWTVLPRKMVINLVMRYQPLGTLWVMICSLFAMYGFCGYIWFK